MVFSPGTPCVRTFRVPAGMAGSSTVVRSNGIACVTMTLRRSMSGPLVADAGAAVVGAGEAAVVGAGDVAVVAAGALGDGTLGGDWAIRATPVPQQQHPQRRRTSPPIVTP